MLEVKKLVHEFPGGKRGLDGVDLTLKMGEFAVLAGANGSGKTVLMRHLNGLSRPSSGEVLLDGRPINEDLSAVRRRVGLVFQDCDSQIVGQTVSEDVGFGPANLRLKREEIRRRVKEVLTLTGLEDFAERRSFTLSGGEKRRLTVAGVLAMDPDFIILDEPFTGLDWPGSAELLEVLDRLYARGRGLLVITHDLDKVLAHADRLILMKEGQVGADGRLEDVLGKVEEYGVRRPPGRIASMSWKR